MKRSVVLGWMGGWVDVEVRYSEFGRAEMMCLPSLFHDDDL